MNHTPKCRQQTGIADSTLAGTTADLPPPASALARAADAAAREDLEH